VFDVDQIVGWLMPIDIIGNSVLIGDNSGIKTSPLNDCFISSHKAVAPAL
jgi:hypothetical protein